MFIFRKKRKSIFQLKNTRGIAKTGTENQQKNSKKILILTSKTGQGHMSAAQAVKETFEKTHNAHYDVEIVDFLELLSSLLNKVTQKTYDRCSVSAPLLWHLIFKSTDKKWQIKLLNQINYPLVEKKLYRFLEEKKPDFILSTFPIGDDIVMEILKRHNYNIKFVSLITDSIFVHHAWITANPDYHIVPNNDTALTLKKLGIKKNKIKVLGFPIRLDFFKKFSRTQFLQEQNLNPDFFTILFLPTAQKQKKNLLIMKELLKIENANIIVIAGRDKKIKQKLDHYSKIKNIKILGWTDQMAHFIKISDLVITKAGGAIVMECIATQKPMIITSMIAQETGNGELIKKYKLGIITKKIDHDFHKQLIFIEKNYNQFKASFKKVYNPKAASKIVKFIIDLLKRQPEKKTAL